MSAAATTGDVIAAMLTALADSSVTGLNGPYLDRKPSGTTIGYPYCILSAPHAAQDDRTSASEYWKGIVRFQVWTILGSTDGWNWIGLLGSVFDEWTASLSAGAVLQSRRLGESVMEEDKGIWQAVVQFEVTRQKPRT